ncbi:conserved protein of unknown function [Moritella yayanosii]|uniref:Uncharacterized protein n=1 Tax=Moritella yayanosii TaxID=69539 RepID=A0A330LID7_9GAMM|nr:conserved protein of unknown function [Moritella yayanosii]
MTLVNYLGHTFSYSDRVFYLTLNLSNKEDIIMSCCGGCGGQDQEETKKVEETEQDSE